MDIPENIPPPQADVWRVEAQWVFDLNCYNEWMVEKDYQVDETGKPVPNSLGLTLDDIIQM